MHSVLNLKSDRSVPEEDETFEEGLVETGFRGFLVHDRGTELRVICDRGISMSEDREEILGEGIAYLQPLRVA